MLKLNECAIGGRYVVDSVQVDEGITRRLEALRMNEGTTVNILNKKRRDKRLRQRLLRKRCSGATKGRGGCKTEKKGRA